MALCPKCRTTGRLPRPGRPGRCARCGEPLSPPAVRQDLPHALRPVCPMPAVVSKPTNEGPVMTDEEREFLLAIDRYKRTWGRVYPTWLEVLAVVKHLGYARADVDAEGRVKEAEPAAAAAVPF